MGRRNRAIDRRRKDGRFEYAEARYLQCRVTPIILIARADRLREAGHPLPQLRSAGCLMPAYGRRIWLRATAGEPAGAD
jgi:hypothetical protein